VYVYVRIEKKNIKIFDVDAKKIYIPLTMSRAIKNNKKTNKVERNKKNYDV